MTTCRSTNGLMRPLVLKCMALNFLRTASQYSPECQIGIDSVTDILRHSHCGCTDEVPDGKAIIVRWLHLHCTQVFVITRNDDS